MSKNFLVKEGAYSLLEQAIVLPALLIFIFGAIDINTGLQSYNALQEGASTALRCVYTTDGKCVEYSANPRVALYEYFKPEVEPEIYGDKYNYSGTEKYIGLPDYEIRTFSATVLNQYSYEIEQFDNTAAVAYYPAKGIVEPRLIYTSDFPRINGTNSANASFRYNLTPHNQYQSKINFSVNASGSNSDKNNPTVFTTEILNMPVPAWMGTSASCFFSQNFNRGTNNHPADESQPCTVVPDINYQVPIVIHVKGNGHGTGSTQDARLRMYLIKNPEQPRSNRRVIDLGGRLFTGPVNQNYGSLVPRGVPENFINENYFALYPEEYNLYQDIKLKYGQKFRLRFVLTSESGGTVRWQANSVDIYTPQYIPANEHEYACINPIKKSEEHDLSACTIDPAANPNNETISDVVISGPRLYTDPATTIHLCNPNDLSMEQMSQSLGTSITQISDYVKVGSQQNSPACTNLHSGQKDCPAGNRGVTPPLTPEKANQECPVVLDTAHTGLQPVNIHWTETTLNFTLNNAIDWQPETCDEASPPSELKNSNSQLSYYKNTTLGQPHFVANDARRYDSGPGIVKATVNDPNQLALNDPERLVVEDPRFNCSGYAAKEKSYNNQYPALPASSLFNGPVPQLGCDWAESIREEAMAAPINMPANAFFLARSELALADPVRLPEVPDSECIDYRPYGEQGEKLIPLGIFPAGSVPEECENSLFPCVAKFVGFDGDNNEFQEIKLDVNLAAEGYGFGEIKAAYPRARWNCEGDDCVKMEVFKDNEHLVAQAKIRVPLKLLFGKSVEFTHTAKERWEGELM